MSDRMPQLFSFCARVIRGAQRGRDLGSPTLNLEISSVPRTLSHGIYACTVTWNQRTFPAAMHFGPRPVFHAGTACEIHVIGHAVLRPPRTVAVTVLQRLRSIRNFPTPETLQQQIRRDLKRANTFLKRQRDKK